MEIGSVETYYYEGVTNKAFSHVLYDDGSSTCWTYIYNNIIAYFMYCTQYVVLFHRSPNSSYRQNTTELQQVEIEFKAKEIYCYDFFQ